jgi:hypothetical protein
MDWEAKVFFNIGFSTAYTRFDSNAARLLFLRGTMSDATPASLILAASSDIQKLGIARRVEDGDIELEVRFPITDKQMDDTIDLVFRALSARSEITATVYEDNDIVMEDEDWKSAIQDTVKFEVEKYNLHVTVPLPPSAK